MVRPGSGRLVLAVLLRYGLAFCVAAWPNAVNLPRKSRDYTVRRVEWVHASALAIAARAVSIAFKKAAA